MTPSPFPGRALKSRTGMTLIVSKRRVRRLAKKSVTLFQTMSASSCFPYRTTIWNFLLEWKMQGKLGCQQLGKRLEKSLHSCWSSRCLKSPASTLVRGIAIDSGCGCRRRSEVLGPQQPSNDKRVLQPLDTRTAENSRFQVERCDHQANADGWANRAGYQRLENHW